MPKRRKEARKKLSPKRRMTSVIKEQATSNSVVADDDNTNDYSSGTASAAQVEPMVSRPLTRSARKKNAVLSIPSRSPIQNHDGNSSEEAATLLLVKQILFDSHRVDKGGHVPVEALSSETPGQAKDAHSSDESICSDKTADAQNDMTPSFQDETVDAQNDKTPSPKDELPGKNVLDVTVDAQNDMTPSSNDEAVDAQNDMIPSSKDELPSKNVLDLKKFAWDLLIQAQHPEPFQVASPCSGEIMVNFNLPEKEANVGDIITNETEDTANGSAQISENLYSSTRSIIPTASLMDINKSSPTNKVMSDPGAEDDFIDVQGYKMEKDVAPLLEAIFNKYGDIAKGSTFSSVKSRTCLLELVCSIYKRLEASKFTDLEPWELESMHSQVGDLELVKVDVGWLHRRLDQISKAQQMCEGGSTLKDIKARSLVAISEKQKAVQICVEEFKASMAAALKLQEKIQQEKDELSTEMSFADGINNIYDGSLVKGLV